MLKGVAKRFAVVSTQALKVLAMLMGEGGGRNKFHPLKKKGKRKVLACLGGEGAKSFRPTILHFYCPPPPPIINDRPLERESRLNLIDERAWVLTSDGVSYPPAPPGALTLLPAHNALMPDKILHSQSHYCDPEFIALFTMRASI